MPESTSEAQQELVALAAAIDNPRWEFRTVDGLAKDLKLSPEEIAQMILEHPEIARKSILTDRHGRELYAARGRSSTLRERLEKVRWVLAH